MSNITDENPAADWQHSIGQRRLRPLNDRVLVRRLEDFPNLPKMVIVPEEAQTPSRMGYVVSCGPGKRDEQGYRQPLEVKPGDLIYFGRFTDFDDSECVLIQEADIVGVIQPGANK